MQEIFIERLLKLVFPSSLYIFYDISSQLQFESNYPFYIDTCNANDRAPQPIQYVLCYPMVKVCHKDQFKLRSLLINSQ